MLHLGLSASEQASFDAALVDSRRRLRFTAQLYSKTGNPLAKSLTILDGEVVIDATARKSEPTRTAFVTLADPDKQLQLNVTQPDDGDLWFAKSLQLHYGVYVRDLNRWVDVPVFHGYVFEVSRHGIEVDIDLIGKDAQHLPPHVFPKSFEVKRGTRINRAIRDLFETRGESKFQLDRVTTRLARTKTWIAEDTLGRRRTTKGTGASPWKAAQNLADAADMQLFYRPNGFLRLREWPESPSWRFNEGRDCVVVDDADERYSIADIYNMVIVRGERTVKIEVKSETKLTEGTAAGATSIKVASSKNLQAGRKISIGSGNNPETRKVAGSYTPGSKTVPLSRALNNGHKNGAQVMVRHREDRARPIIGRASLTQNHPLSAPALTNNKRPRIRIEDRPGIHKKSKAQDKAEAIMRRMKVGVEQDVGLAIVPIPHLEEGDLVRADVSGVEKRFRIKRMTIPLNTDDFSELGWTGRRVPKRRRRR